jgi:hypothetical protein
MPTPPEPRPKQFIIDRIEGGFVVRNGDLHGSFTQVTDHLRCVSIRRGNLSRNIIKPTSTSQHMKMQLHGATAIEKKENRLESED